MTNFTQDYYGNSAPEVIDTNATYAFEEAKRVSVGRTYGEMTLGLIVTALVAMMTQTGNLFLQFMLATRGWGWLLLIGAQVIISIFMGTRIMKMSATTARVLFYVYSALTGFTLSTIFMAFSLGSIAIVFALTAGFFLCLTMLALTTKKDLLKAGPILMVALVALVITQVILMFVAPGAGVLRIVAAIGILIFAGLTAYDAQSTRALLDQYANQPEMVKKLSIFCAFQLYLDFINMFIYLLELLGNNRD
ncbi:BAX inhibitor (BI)-1/YccA family protein [Bifidobacteriaceae bacterium NR002]|nr:BAX inhibitor (BI)-1/YccA family protein [Bifidobacteriaceae bacterium NR002]MDZ7549393.1 Bax inhibitor-1/YccA family protein [Bifidobacteriaceae bacterium NR047]